MTAPAFPTGTFATEGRGSALVPDRGVGGQRQPPADGGGFADIISKLAAPPQARGDAAAGVADGAAAAARSSETAMAVPDAVGADGRTADDGASGARAEARAGAALLSAVRGTGVAGATTAAGVSRFALPAAEFLPAAATAPGAPNAAAAPVDAPAATSGANGPVASPLAAPPWPASAQPLAAVLADAAASAGPAAGEAAEPAVLRPAADGARTHGTATGRTAWPLSTVGAGEAGTTATVDTPASPEAGATDLEAPGPRADLRTDDPRAGDRGFPDSNVGARDVGGSGLPAPSADAGAALAAPGGIAPVPAVVATPEAGATKTAAPTAPAAGPDADPAAPLPAEAEVAETPAAAAPERAVERVTATVRDMRTHFAPVAPRRAPLPAEPAPAPAAGPATGETTADRAPAASGPAPRPVLQSAAAAATVAPSVAVPAAPAAAAAPATPSPIAEVAAAAMQPSAMTAAVGAVPAADDTGRVIDGDGLATRPEAEVAGRRDGPPPVATDRPAPTARSDERPAPAQGASTEAVRSREPVPADADRRVSPAAGAAAAVEPSSPATGNGFPATLNALAKDIGEAARAAAAGPPAGPGQPAPSSGLAAAAPGAHALRRDVEIDLSSSELGVVKVRMRLTGTSLEVRLRTDDAATLALLADRRAELERSISESGVEARIVDVTRATTASGAAPPPGPGPQLPAGGDGREASGQRFEQGASPERQDHRRPGDDHQTYGTTSDEDQPHRTGPRAGTLFV